MGQRSLNVIEANAIRKLGCSFAFYSNYGVSVAVCEIFSVKEWRDRSSRSTVWHCVWASIFAVHSPREIQRKCCTSFYIDRPNGDDYPAVINQILVKNRRFFIITNAFDAVVNFNSSE